MTRIYIVEDEMPLAMLVEDMVIDLGHEVVGMSQRLDEALIAADTIECDLAILDINLNGELSFPVARKLVSRRITIIFASGCGAAALESDFLKATLINKPFSMAQLGDAIERNIA
ncbi:CheY family response regulator [Pseudomonas fluorescens]|uniref:CheY family response regulator n=1 Tax=Pseudomonas fluorescens TaxID=294 RepID=A0A448DYU2_PSEFL|nr:MULTISPECIES: response regulator [Pseudomonas]PRW84813.1 hypothetical protein C7A11_25000 [Pseudomonas simiae]VEF11948.1 CheY family response regulator [Pseudomonas fluorescens]